MSKADFIETVAREGEVSKAEAKRTVDLVFGAIETSLKSARSRGKLQIGTLGIFTISKRAARTARNPRTGEPVKVKASRSLRFRPSLQLKRAAGC